MSRFLIPIITLSLIFWAIWFLIYQTISPITSEGEVIVKNIIFFFSSFWIASSTLLAIFIYLVKIAVLKRANSTRKILRRSLRQGGFLGLILIGAGILKLLKVINPFNILLLIGIIISLEVYFSSKG